MKCLKNLLFIGSALLACTAVNAEPGQYKRIEVDLKGEECIEVWRNLERDQDQKHLTCSVNGYDFSFPSAGSDIGTFNLEPEWYAANGSVVGHIIKLKDLNGEAHRGLGEYTHKTSPSFIDQMMCFAKSTPITCRSENNSFQFSFEEPHRHFGNHMLRVEAMECRVSSPGEETTPKS